MTEREKITEIARKFHETNQKNGFNEKTFEGCGTIVKNNDVETKEDAPLIGNLKVGGKSITLVGKFKKNNNGNDQISLKGFIFDKEKTIEIDDFWGTMK